MTWEPEVEEVRRRRELALALGGDERVARHHREGRLTIRERIDKLVDPGSFDEIGQLSGKVSRSRETEFRPDGYIGGLAKIDGREVAIGGEDFTIRGGSGSENSAKSMLIQRLAVTHRIPLVSLRDGAGFDIAGMLENDSVAVPGEFDGAPMVQLLATVPVVTAIMGSVAGGPAGFAMMSHWSCMVKGTSQLFTAGPPIVKRSLGLEIDKEQLGGSYLHAHISGAVDNEAEDEEDCLSQIKAVLSYLPSNVWSEPPYRQPSDRPDRQEEELLSIIPRNKKAPYDMRRLIRLVVDEGEFFEIQPYWGASLITAFAKLNGHPTGVLANNPMVKAGAIDHQAAEKQARFMEICDQFSLPMVYFVDVPGLMVGPEAEANAVIRKGMRAFWVTHSISVPLINVNVRRSYGFGGEITANGPRMTAKFAWPSAEFGGIPIEGGIDASFKRIINSAPDPEAKRQEILAKFDYLTSPFPVAQQLGVFDIIDPRETRPRLIRAIESALPSLSLSRSAKCRPGVRP
jgi:acetyl-CoA carboxylase carboxyltransferase component